MKHVILCCALLLALQTYAQDKGGPVRFGVQGDITNLNVGGQLKNIYGLGLGGGLHLDLDLGLLSFRLSGDYLTLSPDRDKYRDFIGKYLGTLSSNVSIDGGKINVWSGNLNAKLVILPIPVLNPYVTGGVGLVNISSTDATVMYNGQKVLNYPAVKGQTQTALNAGVGADLNFGSWALYGEVKVNWIFTEGETSAEVPLGTIGITF